MIRTFRDREVEALFHDQEVPRFRAIERVARRKLLYLSQASDSRILESRRATGLRC